MTLIRTKSGLQNLHILKGVDLVVYTEGGDRDALTKEEVLEGGRGYEKSVDIRFWRGIFGQFSNRGSIKFLAVGGCRTLEGIAKEISDGNLRSVCVAMDRDYSNFWGLSVQNCNVIYTRTYSWENELFNSEVILRAFRRLALDTFDPSEILTKIDAAKQSLISQFRHLVVADMILVAANSSLFDRKQPASCFKHVKRQDRMPEIDRSRLRSKVKAEKAKVSGFRLINPPRAESIDVARDVFGKPLLVAAVRILQLLISDANQKSLPNDYLEKFLLDAFFDWINDNLGCLQAVDYGTKVAALEMATENG
ncbi:DUF4435 domain-containing protein [Sedimentitalea todarodis]|uniref:DUF4435 domain-containing protein n=1 Tax=Sedimentitalea todarodis TaxID=1631240 RepID=A0ABU3VBH7_9RHOB|nr:DUF4435 domain-containing protein [Sedimentitalea todarodis]MDU9003531.1 DUF4435 domain-containing protein [Sedimentitalea todarodis]